MIRAWLNHWYFEFFRSPCCIFCFCQAHDSWQHFCSAPRSSTCDSTKFPEAYHIGFSWDERYIYLPEESFDVCLGVKSTCLEAPGVSLGGSGVSMRGVRILVVYT